ncbi:signal peptidase I [Nesterenkonia ebinurensis]|uniref:signal peptidase I n=1 Tax=Nesterenkonia ebinurensis TaxID=2608252 RepID=UPI00123D421D|nr:signal peptidase I [Nesterenkonia ebinurensis]
MTRRRRWIISVGVVVVLAVLVSTLVRVSVADVYTVNQDSMEPTLSDGERMLVVKDYPGETGVRPGDVVVFDGEGSFDPYQGGPSLGRSLERVGHWFGIGAPPGVYVKRVIGADGDLVICCDETGHLTLNGEQLAEPYLDYEITPETPASQLSFEAQVPAGRMWVMGDNRDESVDSRDLLGAPGGGMISQDRIIGKATQVVWPWAERRELEGDTQ